MQQRFHKKINISLFVSRRLKYVHLGLDIPLQSTSPYSELLEVIKDFKNKNRDPKYLFIFPRLTHATMRKYDSIIFEKKDM